LIVFLGKGAELADIYFCNPLWEPNGTQPNPGRYQVRIPGDIISECPGDFVAATITKIVDGHPNARLDELLPWAYPTGPA
jgi:hypothetical protein